MWTRAGFCLPTLVTFSNSAFSGAAKRLREAEQSRPKFRSLATPIFTDQVLCSSATAPSALAILLQILRAAAARSTAGASPPTMHIATAAALSHPGAAPALPPKMQLSQSLPVARPVIQLQQAAAVCAVAALAFLPAVTLPAVAEPLQLSRVPPTIKNKLDERDTNMAFQCKGGMFDCERDGGIGLCSRLAAVQKLHLNFWSKGGASGTRPPRRCPPSPHHLPHHLPRRWRPPSVCQTAVC